MRSILRPTGGHSHAKVTFVELFFDLVFVFAVTQSSHLLIGDFTPTGFLHAAILFTGVWWVWIFTSWVTNWMDPDTTRGRLMMFGLTAAGLILSASLPQAFGPRGLAFAGAYVSMQVGRSLFFILTICGENTALRKNMGRILFWLSVSGALWLAGGCVSPEKRAAFWLAALAIEYAGPAMYFRTPGLGRSTYADWKVDGAHMAERCALFVIIALGESLVVTGSTFAGMAWTVPVVGALFASFLGTAAMWWLYFDTVAELGTRVIVGAAETGRIARLAYTYIHLPIVAGIILSAVADEFTLAHPSGHTRGETVVAVVAGNVLYLAGSLLFRHVLTGRWFLAHVAGIVALPALIPAAPHLPAWTFMLATNLVLVAVAAVEKQTRRNCPALAEIG